MAKQASEQMTLEELLAKQMAVVQQALAFNVEITRRLQTGQLPKEGGQQTAPIASTNPIATALVPFQTESMQPGAETMNLAEPLLPKPLADGNDGPPPTSARGQDNRASFRADGPKPPGTRGPSIRMNVDDRDNRGAQSLFGPSREERKRKVKQMLEAGEYNVEDLYSTTGIWQKLARDNTFKNLALSVIALNAIWLAIDTDYNKAAILCEAPPIFQIVENFFCTAFTVEIFVRFMAFEHKCNAFADGWFVFDATLVSLMVWETWVQVGIYLLTGYGGGGGPGANTSIFRIFRLFRLTRVARLARLLRNMPELMILIKAMAMAIRSVFATLCLLLIIIYVFAILFTQMMEGTSAAKGCFETVPMAMNCLLLQGVFTEEREFISAMLDISWVYYLAVLMYLLLGSMTVLNMLIGVLCEVVSVTAESEREELFLKDLWIKMSAYITGQNPHDPHFHAGGEALMISKEQFFKNLLDNDEAFKDLHDVGIDVVALGDFSDFIFRDSAEMNLSTLFDTVLQFRGSNNATVKDIADTRTFLLREISRIDEALTRTNPGGVVAKQ
mmetsp:Transcript_34869/g.81492  ORF Transcript_34869/g.81492 Transcript_34869/m.81492 type:complete len:558 (+) Transcript_34869:111-1784(+)